MPITLEKPKTVPVAAAAATGSVPVRRPQASRTTSLTTAARSLWSNDPSPPSAREIVFFSTRLALLLETGSSLNRSLAAIAAQASDPYMQRVTRELLQEIESGKPLSAAMSEHPAVFDHVFVSMVRAGESAGLLHPMLARQAALLQRQLRFRAALRGALSYPTFLVVLSFLVVIFMLAVIFPRFSGLLADMHSHLPWTTRVFLAIGTGMRRHGVAILGGVLLVAFGARLGARTRRGRGHLEMLQFQLPGIGGVMREVYAGRLLLNLGTLLASRVPLLEAVATTQGLLPKAPYAGFFTDLRSSIEGGRGLAAAFAQSGLFPPTVQEMLQTGESSGSLDRIMLRLAEFYEDEIQERLRVFLRILEPVLLVLMGVVVAGISLSLLLPILKLSSGIH